MAKLQKLVEEYESVMSRCEALREEFSFVEADMMHAKGKTLLQSYPLTSFELQHEVSQHYQTVSRRFGKIKQKLEEAEAYRDELWDRLKEAINAD